MEFEEGTDNQVRKGDPNVAALRKKCVEYIRPLFAGSDSFCERALEMVEDREHVMDFSRIRVLEAAFALIRKGISNVVEYNENAEFKLEDDIIEKYMQKWTIVAFNWGLAGDLKLAKRADFWRDLSSSVNIDVELPAIGEHLTLIDYQVNIQDGNWRLWKD